MRVFLLVAASTAILGGSVQAAKPHPLVSPLSSNTYGPHKSSEKEGDMVPSSGLSWPAINGWAAPPTNDSASSFLHHNSKMKSETNLTITLIGDLGKDVVQNINSKDNIDPFIGVLTSEINQNLPLYLLSDIQGMFLPPPRGSSPAMITLESTGSSFDDNLFGISGWYEPLSPTGSYTNTPESGSGASILAPLTTFGGSTGRIDAFTVANSIFDHDDIFDPSNSHGPPPRPKAPKAEAGQQIPVARHAAKWLVMAGATGFIAFGAVPPPQHPEAPHAGRRATLSYLRRFRSRLPLPLAPSRL